MTDGHTKDGRGDVVRDDADPPAGYAGSRLNALRHGVLSRFTVLPWEDASEYERLVGALVAEHAPAGPTEEHLVEEIAGIIWRKRRLRLAEAASYRRGLYGASDRDESTTAAALVLTDDDLEDVDIGEAVAATPDRTQREIAALDIYLEAIDKAFQILERGKGGAYERALKTLPGPIRESWDEQLSWSPDDYDFSQKPYEATCEDFRRYLEDVILPWYQSRRTELEHRPLIRSQALGEAFQPIRQDSLCRYEVHLDRKLERMLAMLLRLREIRAGTGDD